MIDYNPYTFMFLELQELVDSIKFLEIFFATLFNGDVTMRTQINSSQKSEKTHKALIQLTNKHPEAMVELVNQNYINSNPQQLALSPTYYATIHAHLLAKYDESGKINRRTVKKIIEAVVKKCPLTKPARRLLKQLTLSSQETIMAQFCKKYPSKIYWIVKDRQFKTRKGV